MGSLVTVFAPDGTQGQVPQGRVRDAIAAGGQLGLPITAPDGTPGYVPANRFQDAMQAGGKPSVAGGTPPPVASASIPSVLQPHAPASDSSLQRSFDEQTASDPGYGAVQNIGKSLVRAVGAPFVHPVATAQSIFAATPLGASLDPQGAIDSNPLVSTARGVASDYKAGGVPYAASNLGGSVAGQALLGSILAQAGSAASKFTGVQGWSPVTTPEVQARAISSAVNPQQGVQNFIEAVQKHGGDVTDYAQQNGMGIRGSLDYSKAAKGAADQTLQQFMDMLTPNKSITVPVSDAYQGTLARTPGQGVGRYANLGDVNSRIGDINDLLRPAANAPTEGQTMTAQERVGLGQEHTELTGKLHQALGDATGVPPESIAALREKFGKLYTIADRANAAVNARQGMESNIDQGTRTVPMTAASFAMERLNQLIRGGPMKIADSSLRKALSNSNLQPTQPIPPPRP